MSERPRWRSNTRTDFKADYDLIWWIPAEQPQEISLALADLAVRLGIQAGDNAAEAAEAALERLRRDTAAGGCSSSTTPEILRIWSRSCLPGQAT